MATEEKRQPQQPPLSISYCTRCGFSPGQRDGEEGCEHEMTTAKVIREAALAEKDAEIKRLTKERDKARANLCEFADPAIRQAVADYSQEKLARKKAEAALQDRDAQLRGRLAGPIKHLERIRDLDEQTSDGALGSLARRALGELAALASTQPEEKTD